MPGLLRPVACTAMPALPVYRPEWTHRARFTRPPGGFHLVDATRRWHLYVSHGAAVGRDDGVAVVRFCDEARTHHSTRPRLLHGELVELLAGQSMCPACWGIWEQLLRLPAIL